MHQTVTIASRFKGPPNSANGGYACGLLASLIDGPAEASLKAPPPLNTPLKLLKTETGEAQLWHESQLVGMARPASFELEAPALPNPLTLGGNPVDAPGRPKKFEPFGTCFVCGNDRDHPDALCLHSRLVEGAPGLVAAPWKLDQAFGNKDGFIEPIFLWAALDCPGYFACAAGEAALLGRLTGHILAPLKAEGSATVIGWELGASGRKRRCGTAVFDSDGALVAKAEGLWITVDAAKISG